MKADYSHSARPVRTIPHSYPAIDDKDIMAVVGRLRTRQIAAGSFAAELERRWARHIQVDSATVLMVASGTFAVYVALRLVGVRAGDRVLMPAYSCRALADAVTELRAEPIVVDVDSRYCIDKDSALERMREVNGAAAVIAVHPFGARIDLGPFEALGCPIIEDCAHAPDFAPSEAAAATIYSFQAQKLLTGGEGGAVVANATAANRQLELLRGGVDERGNASGRLLVAMSDLTAALCVSQLEHWPAFRDRRRRLAQLYRASLGSWLDYHAWRDDETPYRWLVRTQAPFDELRSEMNHNGIAVRRPVEPLLHHLFDRGAVCRNADRLYDVTVSLPLYPSLEEADVRRIAEIFLASLRKVSRGTSATQDFVA